jgi:UDP-N-acetylglucosamine 2-epimerase (non-hydrolysing)
MKKVLIVFGTRPEAIKMAPLVKAFKSEVLLQTRICITAQHREMLDQVLETFNIKPDYDLNLMKANQDLYDITSRVLMGMREVLNDYAPDIVLVHGDTTTTFATALSAFYQKIKVGHVEAGLRTGNIYNPWPEEANRKLASQITTFHFAPTLTSKDNLLKENVDSEKIIVTGNTVIDALFHILEKITTTPLIEHEITNEIKLSGFANFPINQRRMILVTGHRRENFGEGFINICNALKEIAILNPDIDIVYPVHLNPNIQAPVNKILSNIKNVYLIAPLRYESFVYLMNKSYFIITDSGGIQEEAPSLGKPVLVMRETSERPEAVDAGTVTLVGTDPKKIIQHAQLLLDNTAVYQRMAEAHNPYGDGKACNRIVSHIKNELLR